MTFAKHSAALKTGDIAYHAGGSGRPLLYLHSAHGIRFSPALDQLATSFRVYLPVMPGFDGTARHDKLRTMADLGDLAADFIDTVIKEPCDVVGHSFGGWIAAWLAARHPDKLHQLVLAAPAGFRPEGIGGLGGDPETLRRRMTAHPERLPAETKDAAMVAQNHAMPRHYHNDTPTDRDLVPLLGNIQAETLVLLGTKDGIIPPESARLLCEKIPHAHLVYLFDAAHALDTDQPERYVQLLSDFLARGEAFVVNWRSRAAV